MSTAAGGGCGDDDDANGGDRHPDHRTVAKAISDDDDDGGSERRAVEEAFTSAASETKTRERDEDRTSVAAPVPPEERVEPSVEGKSDEHENSNLRAAENTTASVEVHPTVRQNDEASEEGRHRQKGEEHPGEGDEAYFPSPPSVGGDEVGGLATNELSRDGGGGTAAAVSTPGELGNATVDAGESDESRTSRERRRGDDRPGSSSTNSPPSSSRRSADAAASSDSCRARGSVGSPEVVERSPKAVRNSPCLSLSETKELQSSKGSTAATAAMGAQAPPQSQPSSGGGGSGGRLSKPFVASLESSGKKKQENESDDSIFKPFVEAVLGGEWNPFEGGSPPGEAFQLSDDEDHDHDSPGNKGERANNRNGLEIVPNRAWSGEQQLQQRNFPTSQQSARAADAELDGLRHIFDSEYERALEDQEIAWTARYSATRRSFLLSTLCMVLYLWLGCLFYRSEAGWSVPDALLFTVYTVTTVGYGGPRTLPNSAAFHTFTSAYVLVGIAAVTVLGMHTYQLLTMEATRIQRSSPLHRRCASAGVSPSSSGEFNQEGQDSDDDRGMALRRKQFMAELEERVREQPFLDIALDFCIEKIKEFRHYLRTTSSGRALGVALPFLGLIALGALVVGPIEGWTPMESIYWSIVTLTTVGYGDYVPTRNASVWFCTLFFIPSSLFFLSFFLAHVAKWCIRMHAIHVARLERGMRLKIERRRAKEERAAAAKRNADDLTQGASAEEQQQNQQREQLQKIPRTSTSSPPSKNDGDRCPAAIPASTGASQLEDMEGGGFTTLRYTEDEELTNSRRNAAGVGLFGDSASVVADSDPGAGSNSLTSGESLGIRYRENVIRDKLTAPNPDGRRPVSFAEAMRSLHLSFSADQSDGVSGIERARSANLSSKPSLGVRMHVQERLARIIAEEVAGFQTGVTIKRFTVSLTIGTLRDTAEKWKIPPQAFKAFRAVAFRALLFVGERDLISEGGDALLRLNAIEFHGIFSPMLAAMGDGRSMEVWLTATDILADVELRKESTTDRRSGRESSAQGNSIIEGTLT